MTSDFTCQVRTNRLFSDVCNVDMEARTITIRNVFAEVGANGFANQISVEFGGIRNPKNRNDNRNGFVIMTYEDDK